MHLLGDDHEQRLGAIEAAPLEDRAARYLTLHAELLGALDVHPPT